MEQTTSTVTSSASGLVMCAGCNKRISDRYLLSAVDRIWHEGCLKCSCCCGRLDELGSTLFVKDNAFFCRKDYLRLYGDSTEVCPLCQKDVVAMQMVMKERGRTYHLECFNCHDCGNRYRVGERFFFCEKDGQILCEEDYRRRLKHLTAETAAGDQPSIMHTSPASVEVSHSSVWAHHGSLTPQVLPPSDSQQAPPDESRSDKYLASYSSCEGLLRAGTFERVLHSQLSQEKQDSGT